MFFYALLALGALFVAIGVICTPLLIRTPWPKSDKWAGGLSIGIIGSVFCFVLAGLIWRDYASDFATYCKQQPRIDVYAERVESLQARLNDIDYPHKSRINLDADSPWASMINALTEAEQQLAEAKNERAVAERSIEAWRRGPMSGVLYVVGDECHE